MEVGQTEETRQGGSADWYPDETWPNKRAAHWYTERGYKVFPVGADKSPMIKGGHNSASADPSQIEEWWSQWPKANIAVACGLVSNLAVIDIDVKHGKQGAASATALEEKHGPYASGLMVRTPTGGSHHWYAHKEAPFNSNVDRAGDGIDLRSSDPEGNGSGYVLAPPSIVNGKRYAWIETDTINPSTIPDGVALALCFSGVERAIIDSTPGLREKILGQSRTAWRDVYTIARMFSTGGLKRLAEDAEPRNDLTLDTPYIAKAIEDELDGIAQATKDQNDNLSRRSTRLGSLLGGMGRSAESADAKRVKKEIVKAALSMKVLDPSKPWDDAAGRRAIDATGIGQFEWGLRHPRDLSDVNTKRRTDDDDMMSAEDIDDTRDVDVELPTDVTKKNTREVKLVSMAEIKAKPIEWLEHQVIPRGMLFMLAGDPGQAKSQLTCGLAASVSTGKPWLTAASKRTREPFNVIMLNAEDANDAVIKPRLLAAGADMSKVFTLQSVLKYDDKGKATEGEISLAHDIRSLDRAIRELGNVALIVIDPISAYLGKVDSHNNSEVRGVLAPLARLAEKHNIAIVCVSHLNKGGGGKVTDRVTGSLAFTAAARAVYIAGADPTDGASDDAKIFAPGKTNLAPAMKGRSYKIESQQVISDGVLIETSKVVWGESSDATSDDVLRGKDDKRDGRRDGKEALATWLATFLADGFWHPYEAIEAAANRAGYDKSKRTYQRIADSIGVDSRRSPTDGGAEWKLKPRN